jgi:hypothetical protein
MSDGGQQAFRRTRSSEYTVRILLSCTCWTRARNHPMHDLVKYGCASGLRHGYADKWWVRSEQNGAVNTNRTYAARQESLKTEEEKEDTA